MAYTWPRVPRVAPGDAITSREPAGLARALNARLRSGLGDGAWRVMWYTLGLFRGMRNGDASGSLNPPFSEFFESYQSLTEGAGEWPVAGPGEPEGANVNSPLPAFVWGNEGAGLPGESERYEAVPAAFPSGAPSNPVEFAYLGELQRGAFDPDTGGMGCPAINAARSWAAIRYGRLSTHLTSWGGYMPGPELLATPCDDPYAGDDIGAPPNYDIFFTPTEYGASLGLTVRHYAGTCQPGPSTAEDYSLHVAAVVTSPWYFLVYLNNGSVDVLPTNMWVEGPYIGEPKLKHTEGMQLPRVLNKFCTEFRGSEQQLAAEASIIPGVWNIAAFDVQRFFESQYPLAPQRGTQTGDSVDAVFPTFSIAAPSTGILPAGTVIPLITGQALLEVHPSCVFAGVLIGASGVADAFDFEVVSGGNVIGSATVTPDETGYGTALLWLPNAATGDAALRLKTRARFLSPSVGVIQARGYELMAYKPDLSDLALVLRLSGVLSFL